MEYLGVDVSFMTLFIDIKTVYVKCHYKSLNQIVGHCKSMQCRGWATGMSELNRRLCRHSDWSTVMTKTELIKLLAAETNQTQEHPTAIR